VFVAYRTYPDGSNPNSTISVVKSSDCGAHWSQPVTVGAVGVGPAGVLFRTPTFAFISVDDTNPDTVYVAYQSFDGVDYNIYVQRSTDGGQTWGAPALVNDDGGDRPQLFPTIDVADGCCTWPGTTLATAPLPPTSGWMCTMPTRPRRPTSLQRQ